MLQSLQARGEEWRWSLHNLYLYPEWTGDHRRVLLIALINTFWFYLSITSNMSKSPITCHSKSFFGLDSESAAWLMTSIGLFHWETRWGGHSNDRGDQSRCVRFIASGFPEITRNGVGSLAFLPSICFAVHRSHSSSDQIVTESEQGLTDRQTDKDGRCTSLLDPTMKLSTGVYKLNFHTGEYFTKQGVKTLYPFVEVCHLSHYSNTMRENGLMIDYIQLFGSVAALSYPIISQSMELYNLPRELGIVSRLPKY
jgi:hypothetical protein